MKTIKLACMSSALALTVGLAASSAHAMLPFDESPQAQQAPPSQQQSQGFKGRLIITFDDAQAISNLSTSQAANLSNRASTATGINMKHLRPTAFGSHVFEVKQILSAQELNSAMIKLVGTSGISHVEVDRMLTIAATPNDSRYNEQWHYYETTGGLNLPQAWDVSIGTGAVVAVIDTGYTSHSDLNANLLPGYDMISSSEVANDGGGRDSDARDTGDATSANECDDGRPARGSSWHGTHVAGTVAAVSNNSRGVAGVAYGAKVVPIRALGKCGGFTSDIADGIAWAAGANVPGVPVNPNPAQVINLSLGGGGSCGQITQSAINQAVSLGATVVVAAGNESQNAANVNPANCANVVTVAATGRTGSRAGYSNFGNVVDLAAPGGDQRADGRSGGVLSTVNNGTGAPQGEGYAFYQGTSMAAPHVAGVAALLYALNDSLSPAEVETILESSTRSFPASCSGCGVGIVDAAAAVALVAGDEPDTENELIKGEALTGLSGATNSEIRFTLSVPAEASNLSFSIAGGSGDADLYVRYAAAPTTDTYDCRPWLNGNNETCNFESPNEGTYHVMIRGYSAYSGVTLVADYEEQSSNQSDSINQANISGARNTWTDFLIDVPAGQSQLNVQISGGSGDADLYLRFGQNPTTSAFDCRPFRNGNNENCVVNNPQAGTYFIRLRGYRDYSGVRLQANSQ